VKLARLALALAVATSVHAQPAPDPKASASSEAEVGERLYGQSDFTGAATHFARAYELDPQPAYLFDLAQAYRFAKDCANAAKYFKQFIDIAQQAQAQNLDKVRRYLADMEACAQEHLSAPAPAPSPAPARPVVGGDQPSPLPPAIDRGASKRHLGIAVGGGGVVLLGLGVLAQHWAGTVETDRNNYAGKYCMTASPCPYATLKKLDDKGNTDSAISQAAYGVGVAAVAAGIALYVLGHREGSEQPVAVAPTANGAAVIVRF
jgi:hypothetical protein